jgi:hypothetical protein
MKLIHVLMMIAVLVGCGQAETGSSDLQGEWELADSDRKIQILNEKLEERSKTTGVQVKIDNWSTGDVSESAADFLRKLTNSILEVEWKTPRSPTEFRNVKLSPYKIHLYSSERPHARVQGTISFESEISLQRDLTLSLVYDKEGDIDPNFGPSFYIDTIEKLLEIDSETESIMDTIKSGVTVPDARGSFSYEIDGRFIIDDAQTLNAGYAQLKSALARTRSVVNDPSLLRMIDEARGIQKPVKEYHLDLGANLEDDLKSNSVVVGSARHYGPSLNLKMYRPDVVETFKKHLAEAPR